MSEDTVTPPPARSGAGAAGGPASFLASEHPCQIHRYHYPPPYRTVTHHVLPLGMGGEKKPPNEVRACDGCHYAVHGCLDDLLAGRPMRGGTRSQRRYALRGYEEWRRSQPAGGAAAGDPGG